MTASRDAQHTDPWQRPACAAYVAAAAAAGPKGTQRAAGLVLTLLRTTADTMPHPMARFLFS